MKKAVFSVLTLLVVGGLTMQSCKKDHDTSSTQPTLYDSLGGTTKVADPVNSGTQIEKGRLLIRSIVDSTIFVIAGDNRINGYFNTLLMEVTSGNTSGFMALSKNLTDFMCVGTGAKNYTYTGKDMVSAHDPAKNSRMNGKADNDDMDAFEEDLVKGAGKAGVPANNPALGSVAKIVESLRSKIVQR